MFKSANQEIDKIQLNTLIDLSQAPGSGPRINLRVQNKTADYQVLNQDSGSIFTNVGDTDAIIYTLPAVPVKGMFFLFINSVDQNMTVNATTANQMRTFNDLDADGVAFSTTSEKIGAMLLVVGDGTYWNANKIGGNTMTVTT